MRDAGLKKEHEQPRAHAATKRLCEQLQRGGLNSSWNFGGAALICQVGRSRVFCMHPMAGGDSASAFACANKKSRME
ncbi:g994 [Coccomyxa elongata]